MWRGGELLSDLLAPGSSIHALALAGPTAFVLPSCFCFSIPTSFSLSVFTFHFSPCNCKVFLFFLTYSLDHKHLSLGSKGKFKKNTALVGNLYWLRNIK